MNKTFRLFFSPIVMAFILVIGIIAMASATFIENDFGAQVARKAVYNARWFEMLLVLFCINLTGSIFTRKLYKRAKFPIFLFHIAFIVMIIGAAITRYVGYEGMMHIREGESSSTIQAQGKALNVKLIDHNENKSINWSETKVLNKNGFSGSVNFKNQTYTFELKYYYPNAIEKAMPVEGGKTTLGFVLSDNSYRGFTYISDGGYKKLGDKTIGFNTNTQADINVYKNNDSLFIESDFGIQIKNMGESLESNTIKQAEIKANKLYIIDKTSIVFQEIHAEAVLGAFPNEKNNNGNTALVFSVSNGDKTQNLTLWDGRPTHQQDHNLKFGDTEISATFGKNLIELPFKLHLDDFEIKRYPGSRSPSSFSSYVQIIEEGKEPKPFHIYMNNILQMEGYRFYQSSYDKDEKGTILSVNYDSLGTNVTYFGYFILFLGIIWSMFAKSSFLRNTYMPKILVGALLAVALNFISTSKALAQNNSNEISKEHAEKFGQLLIQDNKGRTEPIYTFASDLLRKLSRKEEMFGLTPIQVFLEMNMDYKLWMDKPLIKITNKELQSHLGLRSNYASYNDFITQGVGYKLQKDVEKAYNTPPGKQSKFDKAVIKADERLNICYAIFSGSFLKMFPIPDSEDHQWHPAHEALQLNKNANDSAFLVNILPAYFQELYDAKATGDYSKADNYLEAIDKYQQKYAGYELPSSTKIKLEVAYYKWNVFKKLFPFYATIGVIFLFVLLSGIISGKGVSKKVSGSFFALILAGFAVHTIALAVRWYVSGHAPMSNGYESMVFISLITMLAGLIFSRESLLALSATAVLAGFTLMVANLSFMDPEITNLVPVLKSYWLTIHVSVITGSYGFLGLGAILGIINLVLIIIQNKKNATRINDVIHQLSVINHRTLILGLHFLTIGTFLGAVWANESWGRYWGWDPKETWSLITIIVYTFVTHARMIPGVKGTFAFNTLSVYAFFSVLMTYFGVNYYLSGLHSYAAGDPVPIPPFVYISVASIVALTILAYFKFIKNRLNG